MGRGGQLSRMLKGRKRRIQKGIKPVDQSKLPNLDALMRLKDKIMKSLE